MIGLKLYFCCIDNALPLLERHTNKQTNKTLENDRISLSR